MLKPPETINMIAANMIQPMAARLGSLSDISSPLPSPETASSP
jgi:hypothetical protein